jgi:hypothetical protein
MSPLDVLIMESQRGAAHGAEAALTAAGHRVHRCHEPGDRGFPCKGITEAGGCPLDQARIDVALVVRAHVDPKPTPLEDGISCAIRSGVPLVEDGPDLLDPFQPWVAARVDGADLVGTVVAAADHRFDPLRARILDRISILLGGAHIDRSQVFIRFDSSDHSLQVVLDVDAEVDRHLEQAIAVRVLDAIRSMDRTYGEVNVHVNSAATV